MSTFRSTNETSSKRSTEATIKEERHDDETEDKTTEEEELEVLKAKKFKRFSQTSVNEDTTTASSREGQNRVLKAEVESRKKIGDT